MAMNDSTKRKEPEPSEQAQVAEAKQADEKPSEEKPSEEKPSEEKPAVEKPAETSASEKAEGEPDAKRLKASSPDPAVVRKQVEYYLSDENLRHDKFFHDKISADPEGWLEMSLVLSCNKMKALRATKEDVLSALQGSKIELKDAGAALRRPGNAKLPTLEAKPQHQKKNSVHAHDGGCVVVFKSIPAEQGWQAIKEKLRAAIPQKAQLWFVSEVNDKGMCFVATAPFENDAQFFEELTLDVGGAKLKAELCQGPDLQHALKLLPKHIREKREKESRKRQKERNRPIAVGTQKFLNVGALRGRVKEILNSRSDGEHLKPDGSDFKLIKALLDHHPKGAEKSKGMVGIKVARSSQGDNSCFFMVRADGSAEDFSAKKCLDAIEMNPPYVTDTPAAPKKVEDKPAEKKEEAASSAPKADDKADAKKEEAPAEAASAAPKTDDKAEAKKEEAPAEAASAAPKTDDQPAAPKEV